MDLMAEWIAAKSAEKEAQEYRRKLEDTILDQLQPPTKEGSETFDVGDYKVKITQRYNRKIDAAMLEEIAAENAIEAQLGALFRWKPELDMRSWKNAPSHITDVLSEAITVTPGRPSFQITEE